MMKHQLTLVALSTLVFAAAWFSEVKAQTPEYGIKDDRPAAGSAIRPYAVRGSAIPIDKTYEELTPEEKQVVNTWYEHIPPGDEPPFPLEGLRPIYAALSKAQAKLMAQGELYIFATVDAKGQVTSTKIIGNPSPEMTKFAASLLLLTKFKPAVCGGAPCIMDFPLRHMFIVN
ncbi:hypothetical protein HZ992_15025 [Rhizobacter sp. AJA081-3]|uniref:energy transducer TonB n=1 Tax=Rhizobacter sp. AJA081-3 TaxID=2753607 RepID=UPI001AE0357A|nr:hypothetical protein [Rhizobacter sp. AJA081-3]QTN21497.1 hypothetical protein HZ992_15025 [Rhizobacter sp. AJA081-3]